jgi:hypothetical protein
MAALCTADVLCAAGRCDATRIALLYFLAEKEESRLSSADLA